MKAVFYSLFIVIIFVFAGCTTKFDINATPQDITVVYGLLNQSDSTQYIKITKAFLGESSAYEMAQDPSLSSYGNDLTVTLTEMYDGNTMRTITLQKSVVANKDSGMFYYPNQEIYLFKPVPLLNAKYTYKLTVKNNTSNKLTTATTGMVNDFTVQKPAYNPGNPQIGFVGSNGDYSTNDAEWRSSLNGRIYEPLFRFHYREVNKASLDTSSDKYVDWVLSSVTSETTAGGEDLTISYDGKSFYKLIQAKIPINTNVDRIIGKVDFIISAGGDDLSIYIGLNKPTGSIVQERPSYTNVTNGVGIFSCRFSKKYTYTLNQYSVNKLLNGEYTSQLGFK